MTSALPTAFGEVSPGTWGEIHQLIANFAWGIDRGNSILAAEQFVEDGNLYVPGSLEPGAAQVRFAGRAAIQHRWEGRIGVTTRHAFLNLSLKHTAVDVIAGTVLLLGFRHDGEGRGDTAPAVICDFDDTIVRDVDGRWRFAERRVSIVFSRSTPA